MVFVTEKLRGEERFVDKTVDRFPITSGDGQLALANRHQDAVDPAGEFEVRCIRENARYVHRYRRHCDNRTF